MISNQRLKNISVVSQSSFLFDGVNDQFANISFFGGNFLSITPSTAWTVGFWIKPITLPGEFNNEAIFSRWAENGLNSSGYRVYITGGNRIQYTLFQNLFNFRQNTSTAALSLDKWTHVIITDDGSNTAAGLRIFMDGVDRSSVNITGAVTSISYGSNQFRIGAINSTTTDGGGQTNFMNCHMYQMFFLNHAINLTDAKYIYNGSRTFHGLTGNFSDTSVTFPFDSMLFASPNYVLNTGSDHNPEASSGANTFMLASGGINNANILHDIPGETP